MSGRIRTIKPEVLDDEVAAGLSDAAWRLWVSSWVLADDYGNVRAGSKYLGAQVWQDSGRDVESTLAELISSGLVSPYAVHGQRYVHIAGWEKHQRVDNAGKRRVPPPESDDGTWNRGLTVRFAESSANVEGDPHVVAETLVGNPTESPLARAPAQARLRTIAAGPPTSDPDPEGTSRARAREGGPGLVRAQESPVVPTPPPDAGVTPLRHGAGTQAVAEEYAEGVREVLGATWAMGRSPERDLIAAVNAHAPPGLSGAELRARVRASVRAYVTATRDEPKFQSGWQPLAWLKWLNTPPNGVTLARPPHADAGDASFESTPEDDDFTDYEDPSTMSPERLAERKRLAEELERAIGSMR